MFSIFNWDDLVFQRLRTMESKERKAPSEENSGGVRGFLLHVFHRQQQGKTLIHAVGRLETDETFGMLDTREQPGFYVRGSDLEAVQSQVKRVGGTAAESALTTMDGEPVVRVNCSTLAALRRLARQLREDPIRTYQADVNYGHQYLMDRGLRSSVRIEGSWQPGRGVDRVYIDPQLTPCEWEPELAALALDIETDREASQAYAVSLVGTGPEEKHRVEEIHLAGAPSAADPPETRCYPDERHLLQAVAARIRDIDPDVLTGWNLIDFDLVVLQKRFEAHGLPFNLGRTYDDSWYREGEVWGSSRMVVYGRQILDALHLVRAAQLRCDDFRLDTVARAVLGRGKTLQAEENRTMPEVILEAYHHDRKAFCAYCLEDSRLVLDILDQEGLIALTLRRSLLTGLPLERAWGSVAAFDFLYISELHRRGMVAPSTGVDGQHQGRSPGGLVFAPDAGLYRHVFVFDFKSLYPSLIRTFNIDPLAHIRGTQEPADEERDPIEAPNGARFAREAGILPAMLERFFASRDQARARGDALASYTYKITMNSFYGVLATGACRFASDALAGAITECGHYVLRWTRSLLEGAGCRVIYGDTDSVFVDANLVEDIDPGAARGRGRELCAWVNEKLAAHVAEQYRVVSRLELEFEKHYARFFLPPMRGSEKGRSKGYAGLRVDEDGEHLDIVGMEAVRRDWTRLAHDLQRELLHLLFHDAPAAQIEDCVGEWIRAVRAGEKDEDLVYRKALRKPVAEYTRTRPPHVQAARLLHKPSGVIHYVVTRDGPQPVGHVSAPLDYEHYVQKQIDPLVRTIAQVCDIDVDAALKGEADLFRSYSQA